jgi:hypothetical protein
MEEIVAILGPKGTEEQVHELIRRLGWYTVPTGIILEMLRGMRKRLIPLPRLILPPGSSN